MKKMALIVIILISFISVNGCVTTDQINRDDYEILCSAVTACSYAMIGKYGENIPEDLEAKDLLTTCKGEIPSNYYAQLKTYQLQVRPKGTYYLLSVYDDGKLVMFDYSCTPKCDGRIMLDPAKYDVNKDPCKD